MIFTLSLDGSLGMLKPKITAVSGSSSKLLSAGDTQAIMDVLELPPNES